MSLENKQTNYIINEAPFSFNDWVSENLNKATKIILTNKKMFLLVVLIGSLLGLTYSYYRPVKYVSEITFLVEENKGMGGSGLLSSLGGSLGMDIAGLTGSSNTVLSGDNVLQLLKTNSFMISCLKTPYLNDSNYTLADKYADVYGFRQKWASASKINRAVFFNKPDVDIRLQDSLMKIIVKRLEEKELSVTKPDKKLGFFKVNVNTKDEWLSKLIAERLIKIASQFYVESKVGRLQNNVTRLEKRTDSISNLLNRRTYATTEDQQLLLNLNPADINARSYAEISQRDKLVLSTIYGELIKNLEISKTALIQETPTVQIIDSPQFPLERDEVKWYQGLFYGVMISLVSCFIFYAYKKQ